MADMCSRAWHLNDNQLLTLFNSRFPQAEQWRLCRLRKEMHTSLISSLFRKPSDLGSLLKELRRTITIGRDGFPTASPTVSTRGCDNLQTLSPSCRSSSNAIGMEGSPAVANPSGLEQLRTPYERWARSLPTWGPTIPGKMAMAKLISESPGNFELTRRKTSLPLASNQYPSHW